MSVITNCLVLYGVNSSSIVCLQLVQNAATRFLTGTKRWQQISPILANLHWFPIRDCIKFQIFLVFLKISSCPAPSLIVQLVCPQVPTQALRFSDLHLLHVSKVCCKTCGEEAFSVCAPRQLSLIVRLAPSLTIFKSQLKTHFYSLAFNSD